MLKSMVAVGVLVFVIGALALFGYVVPWIGGMRSSALMPTAKVGPPGLAVTIAAIGLPIGAALIGIGIGRWKNPRPSARDGHPEV